MTTIEDRKAYLNNPFNGPPIFGDYTAFYITIGICSVFLAIIIVLNFVIGCCSKHKYYWYDRHTGNRFLVSIWSATPHQQPPLDLTELKDVASFQPVRQSDDTEYVVTYPRHAEEPRGYGRTLYHHQQQPHHSQHHQHQPEEYVELHKRESDI